MKTFTSDINSIFKLYDKDTELLERIVKDSPASSIARMALLKKYKDSEDPRYEDLLGRSAFYMGNIPYYLYVMSQAGLGSEAESGHFAVTVPVEHIHSDNGNGNSDEENNLRDRDNFMEEENRTQADDNVSIHTYEGSHLENAEAEEVPETNEEEVYNDTNMTEAATEEIFDSTDSQASEEMQMHPDENKERLHRNESPDRAEDTHNENSMAADEEISLKRQESFVTEESPDNFKVEERGDVGEDERNDEAPGSLTSEIETQPEAENITATSEEPTEQKKSEDQIPFEPLHTIDYFASQGIKLREEDLTNDKLGQQVKSFTGWLKSMKQLHPGKLPEQDEVIEKIIQNAAEGSNVETDVLTEAMADVLVKQNKKDKAVEMYQKLSLMNPSKSAYFAAKIENLKA